MQQFNLSAKPANDIDAAGALEVTSSHVVSIGPGSPYELVTLLLEVDDEQPLTCAQSGALVRLMSWGNGRHDGRLAAVFELLDGATLPLGVSEPLADLANRVAGRVPGARAWAKSG